MVVIVSILSLLFLSNPHSLHRQHCIRIRTHGERLGKLLFTQGARHLPRFELVTLIYHGSRNWAACSGLLYFPLMFSLNAAALINASVGFVSQLNLYHKSIDRLIVVFRQFVPHVRYHRLRCHLSHIKHYGMFNFLPIKAYPWPLTKLPRPVDCKFSPSSQPNTKYKYQALPRFQRYSNKRIRLKRPTSIWYVCKSATRAWTPLG